MKVIGTAGHVDHGKSALVNALTGINPDRLREEQERQMTIDLGFAWLTLPHGESVGIVDVPGHRDFIDNMLAGVGGIDAAMFVIAADEGVMPQTREHLNILDLLQIGRGVVVLSKLDVIDDPDWLTLVKEDVRKLLKTTILENASIVPVSAHSGDGMQTLIEAIQQVLSRIPARKDLDRPRLSIDRAFTISGFGTVVTGTLVDGSFRVGDEIEIMPRGLPGRVRGLQTHKSKIEQAIPGSRVAVNISGIDVDEIQRGDVLVHPGTAGGTQRIDVHFQLLKSSGSSMKHNQEVKLFVGAAQRVTRVRLLGTDELQPGEDGWLQLETAQPVVIARGDRYILRRPSPPATIGGGVIVDVNPGRRHRRKNHRVIQRLEQYLLGDPEEILIQTLKRVGIEEWKVIADHSGLDEGDLEQAREKILEQDLVIALGAGSDSSAIIVDRQTWDQLTEKMLLELTSFHENKRLRSGMSIEELRSRLQLEPKLASAAFKAAEAQGLVKISGKLVGKKGFVPQLSEEQQKGVEKLLQDFKRSPYATPSIKKSIEAIGEEVFHHLVSSETLVSISDEVVFRREDYSSMVDEVKVLIEKSGTATVAEVRDHFGTSRKYVLALMEHLDSIGITVREGDYRRLSHPKN